MVSPILLWSSDAASETPIHSPSDHRKLILILPEGKTRIQFFLSRVSFFIPGGEYLQKRYRRPPPTIALCARFLTRNLPTDSDSSDDYDPNEIASQIIRLEPSRRLSPRREKVIMASSDRKPDHYEIHNVNRRIIRDSVLIAGPFIIVW